ncbi:NAD(P)H-binding protein [Nocardia sp. NPDC057272]|uniref:NAD(P)H-binding protein n=1 Tax=Nocardia sp. NPDC057272 TaxID=3346079 RepID=UPI003632CBA6
MTTYAVTGASGPLGRSAIDHLIARGAAPHDIVAVLRSPDKGADLVARGIDVRYGDYSVPHSLPAALMDVDRLLLVSGSEFGPRRVEQHANVIEAAEQVGVQRVVYTSFMNADFANNPLVPDHRYTEALLAKSFVPHTILRNGTYYEIYSDQLPTYLAVGAVMSAAGSGRVSGAARSDLAEAAAVALLDDSDSNHRYDLGGPGFTQQGLADVISAVTGTSVTYRDSSSDEYRTALEGSGVPSHTARFLTAIAESIARGELESRGENDLPRLIGRSPVTLTAAIQAAVDETNAASSRLAR